jgi:hypothetical protein
MRHLQGGRSNVHAIKEGDDVEDKQEGQETLCNPPPGTLPNISLQGGPDIFDYRRSGDFLNHSSFLAGFP